MLDPETLPKRRGVGEGVGITERQEGKTEAVYILSVCLSLIST